MVGALIFFLPNHFLPPVADFLIIDEQPKHVDAVVVLSTGMEYFSRLMEAADLYKNEHADIIVINGNRKNEELRKIEMMGYRDCCPWPEDTLRMLEVLGVPRQAVTPISVEDAYDTESEALAVGGALSSLDIKSIIVTTSKTHTRRAMHIWKRLYGDRFELSSVAAKNDPFSPQGWWKEGRQVRWILYEYGSWVFYYWKQLAGK